MGDARLPAPANLSAHIFEAQIAFAEIAPIAAERALRYSFCHSERSEAATQPRKHSGRGQAFNLGLISCRGRPAVRDPSPSLRRTRCGAGYNKPRLRKSPRLLPDERSTRSIVNLRRQTSHASSTPCIIALSASFLFSTCRLVRLITVSIESLSVRSLKSVLRN